MIHESLVEGALALNYTVAKNVVRNDGGDVSGVEIEDTETHETKTLTTPTVINATGCWAEALHPSPDPAKHLRPLRGSHLVFPAEAIPLKDGFSFFHPHDHRPIFAVPWEGAVIVGTTDLDHDEALSLEPRISEQEFSYLLGGLQEMFPLLQVSPEDCLSTFSGIRPILSEGKLAPSEESREHVVWADHGLVTVTGGKLTTFRHLAFDTLKMAEPFLPPHTPPDRNAVVFNPGIDPPENNHGLSEEAWKRLNGRYGCAADPLVSEAAPEDLSTIPGTETLWAEIAHAARHERIRHLEDLLLRRVRIGLLTREGGRPHFRRIKRLCRPYLPWSRKRWREKEIRLYTDQWNRAYGLPMEPAGVINKIKSAIPRSPRRFFRPNRVPVLRPSVPRFGKKEE